MSDCPPYPARPRPPSALGPLLFVLSLAYLQYCRYNGSRWRSNSLGGRRKRKAISRSMESALRRPYRYSPIRFDLFSMTAKTKPASYAFTRSDTRAGNFCCSWSSSIDRRMGKMSSTSFQPERQTVMKNSSTLSNSPKRKGIKISDETRRLYEQRDRSLDNDPDCAPLPPERWANAMTAAEFEEFRKSYRARKKLTSVDRKST